MSRSVFNKRGLTLGRGVMGLLAVLLTRIVSGVSLEGDALMKVS